MNACLDWVRLRRLSFVTAMAMCASAAWTQTTTELDLDFEGAFDVAEDGSGQAATLLRDGRRLVRRNATSDRARMSLGAPDLQFEGGGPTQRWAKVVDDPSKPGNRVLEFVVKEPNVGGNTEGGERGRKSRVQMNLYENVGVAEVYQSVRLRLGPGLSRLKDYPQAFGWFTLSEWWNNAGWTREADPFRISVNLASEGAGKGLHLAVHATTKAAGGAEWSRVVWTEAAPKFLVPVGSWMRIEYFFREGGAGDGRFVMRVTPDGAQPVTIVDVTNFTHHPDARQPDGLRQFNPIKLYTSKAITEFVRARGGELMVQWDDLQVVGCQRASAPPAALSACAQKMGVQ
jgi:hypothetical protein